MLSFLKLRQFLRNFVIFGIDCMKLEKDVKTFYMV